MSTDAFELPEPDAAEKGPYALVGQARALPGKADLLEGGLLDLVAPTRREDGVLQYHVHRDRSDPDLFVFYEVWASLGHLKAHLQQPYVVQFLEKRRALIRGEMSVTWLKMVSPYGNEQGARHPKNGREILG